LRAPDPRLDGAVRPGGQARRRRAAQAVQRRVRPRLRVPAPPRRRRSGAHPLDLRDRVGGPRRAGPVRADRDGGRVRRRDPRRPVRAHRRRRDRPRHRRDPRRAPQPRRAHAQPRRLHDRRRRPRGGQGGRDVRGRRPDRPPVAAARRAAADGRRRHRPAVRPLPERLRAVEGPTMSFPNREIWFLTGSQSLYGEDTLRQVAEQSAEIAARLGEALPVAVRWLPVLTGADAIRRTCLDAGADDACIGVIAWMHTFSPAKMWIAGLDVLTKPLLHLHTQANVELPWASIDMDFMNLNQAAHGDREFGFVQARVGVARTTVAGHVSDPSVGARAAGWARAAAGLHELRRLKLARFGDNMRDVAVTEGDKVEAQLRFGVSVNTYGVNDLVEVVDAVPDADVTALVKEYQDLYDVAPELRTGGERHDSLRYGARIELGLRTFLDDG